MEYRYAPAHIFRTMALDGVIFLIGLALLGAPFIEYYLHGNQDFFPGDIETTSHVALGGLIAVLAIFRVAVAYGSHWIEFCLFFLGLIVLSLPKIMVMQWNHEYTTAHLAAGGGIMVLSLISGLLTLPARRQRTAINTLGRASRA